MLPETALVGQGLAVELGLLERLLQEDTTLVATLERTIVSNEGGYHVDEVGPTQV